MIRRLFVGFIVLWLTAMVVVFSDAGSGVVGMFAFLGGAMALAGAVVVQVLASVMRRRGTMPARRFSGRWQWAAPIALVAAMAMALAEGPSSPLFRARFALSERAFETRARALVTTSYQSTQPEWIGLFRVERIDAHDRQVRFITTPCGVVDACGVVYAPSGPPSRWMEDEFTSLHGAWWHVFEGF